MMREFRPNWDRRWPHPRTYYPGRLYRLGCTNRGWVKAACPFHFDQGTSLWVRLADRRGYWLCTAGCGCGDLVSFHQRYTGHTLIETMLDLIWPRA